VKIRWLSRRPRAWLAVAAVGIVALAAGVSAQRRGFGGYGGFDRYFASEPTVKNVPYDGRFTFVRLKYETGPGGYYYHGLPAWAHGYEGGTDIAGDNLTHILDSISAVHPRLDDSNVFALDDPDLTKYPIAYMTEAGYWEMTDKEAKAVRAYLLKGGFVIFDDFRPPPRGGGGWEQFADNMHRVLPEAQIVDLTPDQPIFHSFFDIDSFNIIPQAYDGGMPQICGIFEDNDPKKRLMAIINFNTDVSEYWEFSSTGFAPVDESNEAYKLGVNYIIYGLTH
jgi:hypothetical protein